MNVVLNLKSGLVLRVMEITNETFVTIEHSDGDITHAESYVPTKRNDGVSLERWHPDTHSDTDPS